MASLTGPVLLPVGPNPVISRSQFFTISTGPLDLPRAGRSGGMQYEISHCNLPSCYEIECIADHNTKTLDNTKTTVTGNPFVIYADELCSPVGLTDDELKQDLYNQLIAGEASVVEATFGAQLCGQAPGLSNNASVTDLGTATDIVDAISRLEADLYNVYGVPGVLHVPYRFGAYFEYLHLGEYHDSKGICRTKLGTAINFGHYPGLTPAGAAPAAGSMYIYITGQTVVWRTPDAELFVTSRGDILNRSTNQLTGVMEREYVVAFDCRVSGILTPMKGAVT